MSTNEKQTDEPVELDEAIDAINAACEQGEQNRGNTFYCGSCGFVLISDYPHDCPVKQEVEL